MEGIDFGSAHTFLEAIKENKRWSYHNESKYVELVNFFWQGSWQFKKHGWWEEDYLH
jgi:hypothetical protein